MDQAPVFEQVIHYRDNFGKLRPILLRSPDPTELARMVAACLRLERQSAARDRKWRAQHTTFTAQEIDGDSVSEAAGSRQHSGGHPWEGPRFSFALLLGEGFIWSGPESLWIVDGETGERIQCRCCGHFKSVPLVACCLNGECNRTGRDLAIPRPTVADLKKREPPKPAEPTKVPPPLRDKLGKVLKGGMEGKK